MRHLPLIQTDLFSVPYEQSPDDGIMRRAVFKPKAGDVIGISAGGSAGMVTHCDVFTERGTVIHNSKHYGKVMEQALSELVNGKIYHRIGFLPPAEVIRRARSRIDGTVGELMPQDLARH